MYRRRNSWLRKLKFILLFSTFPTCHLSMAIWIVGPSLFVSFCSLRIFGSHIGGFNNHRSCKLHVCLSFRTFGICLITTDIWNLGQCQFCSFYNWYSADVHIGQPEYPWSRKLHSFFAFYMLEICHVFSNIQILYMCLLFSILLYCITETCVPLDASCWSDSEECTVWTTMKLLIW